MSGDPARQGGALPCAGLPVSSYEAYRGAVGAVFRVTDGPELVLESVSELAEQGDYLAYSLVFAGPADEMLAQGLIELEHDTIGLQAIFLVPIGADADVVRYEAVFNQHRPAEGLPA